ncbi:hypothetical protein [Streptomyces sp. NRRL F-2664]|uniref:hypothetical protein n=1 Tax=Streptomyces sp. NRRL F-2664 TaxID=1463842 RepID=UPI0004C63F60|nr:hypothetical protein [Streptomyces sp. NRRL F-2664]
MLTDRDERALLAATEDRISRPLRTGTAWAAVRHFLVWRPRARAQGRESVACQRTRTPMHP